MAENDGHAYEREGAAEQPVDVAGHARIDSRALSPADVQKSAERAAEEIAAKPEAIIAEHEKSGQPTPTQPHLRDTAQDSDRDHRSSGYGANTGGHTFNQSGSQPAKMTPEHKEGRAVTRHSRPRGLLRSPAIRSITQVYAEGR